MAEEGHVTTEEGHVVTKEGHVTAEEGHVTAEEGHVTTEEGHVVTKEGHVTAEEGPVMTEEGHITTEEGHVTTEEGHVTAEEGHVMTEQGDDGGATLSGMTPAEGLERLYGAAEPRAEWFAPSFLERVPLEKAVATHARIRARGGELREVRQVRAGLYELVFANGSCDAKIWLDGEERITGVRVTGDNVERWRCMASAAVRGAKRALREPSRLRAFSDGQRRSHLVRGRAFLALSPLIVLVTWVGLLRERHVPLDGWLVITVVTALLARAWLGWWRGLRKIAATVS